MSAKTHARYQTTRDERFRRLLVAWLQNLPPNGWRGTVAELFAELDERERTGTFFVFVPTSSALTKALLHHEPAISAAGFALRLGRTKSARFITIEPDAPHADRNNPTG
ncbi:MAG: hypothetical protein K2V38_28210 [Gemmataceae bacterium]|nr:hypothetical protein [Gemmataceae bacterium]